MKTLENGNLFWFTGLAGAGKTTISQLFFEEWRKKHPVIFLDGDNLRSIIAEDLGYSLEDRKKSAYRNSRLCEMLVSQGVDVICATISMFDFCREWNSKNIGNYHEIYIRVPKEVLIQRDQKQLYSRAIRGEIHDVMGIDIDYEEPKHPHYIIDNDGTKTLSEILNELTKFINEKGKFQ